jgi:hypothetical protein
MVLKDKKRLSAVFEFSAVEEALVGAVGAAFSVVVVLAVVVVVAVVACAATIMDRAEPLSRMAQIAETP